MKRLTRSGLVHGTWVAALATITSVLAGAGWAQDSPPPPPAASAVAQSSPPKPLIEIPTELLDPAFERYADLASLGKAYLNSDASLMTDVGLQLAEGERVLLRSHNNLKAATVLDVAVRIATQHADTTTLERLEKAAARLSDTSLAERARLGRQLASKPRAEVPPPPPFPEGLPEDQAIALEARFHRLSRATATSDLADLKALHDELKKETQKDDPVHAYLEKRAADAVKELSEAGSGDDDVTKLLGRLSSPSRGTAVGPYLETDNQGNVREGARAYWLDSGNPRLIYIVVPGRGAGNGWNEWVPKTSYYGLVGRYGKVKIATNVWLQGTETTGNREKVRFWIYKDSPDWVWREYKGLDGKWYGGAYIGLKDAMTIRIEDENAASSVCTIAQGNSATIKPAALVQASNGSLKVSGNTAGVQIKALPGENSQAKNFAMTIGKEGYRSGSIVAAGGGNVVEKMAGIVAAGGGNIVAAGGGNVLPQGGTNLISKGGAGMTVRVLQSAGTQQRLGAATTYP